MAGSREILSQAGIGLVAAGFQKVHAIRLLVPKQAEIAQERDVHTSIPVYSTNSNIGRK